MCLDIRGRPEVEAALEEQVAEALRRQREAPIRPPDTPNTFYQKFMTRWSREEEEEQRRRRDCYMVSEA